MHTNTHTHTQTRHRFVTCVRKLLDEYVFLAQQLMPPVSSTTSKTASATKMLLSINTMGGVDPDVEEMARPVVLHRQNHHVLQQIRRELASKLSVATAAHRHQDEEDDGHLLHNALRRFKASGFFLTIITSADALGLREENNEYDDDKGDPDTASLRFAADLNAVAAHVQFVLVRSEHEDAARASRNLLRVLDAIDRSANAATCSVRQVEPNGRDLQLVMVRCVYGWHVMVALVGI